MAPVEASARTASAEDSGSSSHMEDISDTDDDYEDMGAVTPQEQANIAYLNSIRIPIQDHLETDSSEVQNETLEAVLPFLEGNPNSFPLNEHGIPKLQRQLHVPYLKKTLGDYPAPFALMDASRPWLVYWSLQGLTAMGHDISYLRERVVHTFSLIEHPDGGYGGGFGQLPHLAPTYAAVLSLAMVGGDAAFKSINRKAMWHYLGQMKQPSGGFTMAPGGEEDIRGAYCGLVVMSLVNIPLELPPEAPARKYGLISFLDNLGEWISQCQSFDGGLSATPGNEAHGAYAFCGLACLSIIGPPQETLNRYLNMTTLIHWLSSRQCAPEGGYNGRTNKLVDGCYSHWVGGCWPLVEAATAPSLWNRSSLARYILSAAQFKKGGLVDKPGKRPDAYHSCYNLAGLSAAQHRYVYDERRHREHDGELSAAYLWEDNGLHEEGQKVWNGGDIVGRVHPVFVVPFEAAHACRRYFENASSF